MTTSTQGQAVRKKVRQLNEREAAVIVKVNEISSRKPQHGATIGELEAAFDWPPFDAITQLLAFGLVEVPTTETGAMMSKNVIISRPYGEEVAEEYTTHPDAAVALPKSLEELPQVKLAGDDAPTKPKVETDSRMAPPADFGNAQGRSAKDGAPAPRKQ